MDNLKIIIRKSIPAELRASLVDQNALFQQPLSHLADGLVFIFMDGDSTISALRMGTLSSELVKQFLKNHRITDCIEISHFYFNRDYTRCGVIPFGLYSCGKWALSNLRVRRWVARVENANSALLESIGIKVFGQGATKLVVGDFSEHINILDNIKNLEINVDYAEHFADTLLVAS